MKTYTHDYTLPAEAEKRLHEAFSRCQDSEMKQLLEDAQELLRKYLSQDNLVEDEDVEGFVRRSDAEAAVKEAENKLKESISFMIRMAKETNAAKTVLASDSEDGFIVETILRKKGVVAYDEFSDDQLIFISDTMFDMIKQSPESSSNENRLAVVNVCQGRLKCSSFDSVEELLNSETVEEE